LLVGVAEVDGQHRALIGELNRLIADPQAVPSSELFTDVLSHLGTELTAHFEFEERCLGRLGLPGPEIEQHVAAHVEILSQYADLNLDMMLHRALTRTEVLVMIQRWVVDHIVTHDLRIRDYLPA
jgi:hemerythrin-like metal-binding protein